MPKPQFSSQKKNDSFANVIDISPEDLKKNSSFVHIVDVRRPDEWQSELPAIASALRITLDTLPNHMSKIPTDKPVVFVCKAGGRSAQATAYALENGLTEAFNLAGGMMAWHKMKE
jgi:hydroxyacylglutathione hydrolase